MSLLRCYIFNRPATLILCNNDDSYIVHVPPIKAVRSMI